MSSLSISGNDPASRLAQTSDEPQKTEGNTKKGHQEFDFSGAAYSAVHVPTGLISAPPSKAQLQADLKDTVESGKKVLEDLKSPELRELLKSGSEVAIDGVKLTKNIVELAEHGARACEGDLGSLIRMGVDAGETIKHSIELGLHLRAFDKANTPEARAKLNELVHDLEAFGKNAAKLENDATKFAGAAPIRFATTGRI